MHFVSRFIAGALALALVSAAYAQGPGTFDSGTVYGNAGASRAPGKPVVVGNGLAMAQSKLGLAGYPVFRPEDYGAVCDNTTDSSVAFGLLAAAVNAAGTGRIEMARVSPTNTANCAYQVYPAPNADKVVMSFSAVNGLTINFNGSKIATTYNFAAARQIYGILLTGSTNVTINDPNYDQSNHHVRNDDRGIRGVHAAGAVQNILITNFTMNGGQSGFGCTRDVSGPKGKNVNIIGASFSNVFYPINAQKSCDNLYATGITAIQPGRSFFVYNVSNMYAQINSDSSDGFDDIIISNVFDAADTTQDAYLTSNIRVDYTNRPSVLTGTGVNSYADILFQTTIGSVEGFQHITDIHLNLDVQRDDARGAAPLLKTENQTLTAKGRILENVYVTGRAQVGSATPTAFMYLMMDKDWTGDHVRNLQFTNLICSYQAAAPFQFDGRAIDGPIILNGVFGNSNCTFAPANAGNTTAAFPFLSYNQVWLPTSIVRGGGVYTPADGSGAALTFTGISSQSSRIDNMVLAYAQLTYPATADASAAKISGLPVTVPNFNYAQQCSLTYSTTSTLARMASTANTAVISLFTAAGVAVTNAQMSGATIIYLCIYPVS